jgi:HD-GYP domain-containing protein (c-di-GMP phosphodiesterase class II)
VTLVPFSSSYLKRDSLLPFALHDAGGRLLLSAGLKVDTQAQLETLLAQPLFVDEAETANWKRRVQAAMDLKMRQGATLGEVAAAVPEPEAKETAPRAALPMVEQWDMLIGQLDGVLRDIRPDNDWLARLLAVRERARGLLARRADASLYCLVHGAGHSVAKYSSSHAMLTMAICQLSGPLLDWPAEQIDSLTLAALTMNVSMLRLQDQLALAMTKPTPADRVVIDRHAENSAQSLQACGLRDKACIEVVRMHHQPGPVDQPMAALDPQQQMARLLHRIDVFAAKISCRASRQAMSPVQAAREAFLGAQGTPDEVGGALLRAVGLYPPGSFVELVSGEVGIVLARGRRSNLPVVAALVSTSGEVMMEPLLRDSIERRHTVKSALRPGAVRVRPPHEKLLTMR